MAGILVGDLACMLVQGFENPERRQIFGEDGNKRARQRALGKQIPRQIRNPKAEVERVARSWSVGVLTSTGDTTLETYVIAANRLAATYSGGMVRRLELAQALVNRPHVLILDEPTVGLDPVARAGVWDRVRILREQLGMTVLLTTHYMEEADLLCDRVALMHRGRVQALGTPAALKADLHPGASLDDVFRHYTGDALLDQGSLRDVRTTRRTARRLG